MRILLKVLLFPLALFLTLLAAIFCTALGLFAAPLMLEMMDTPADVIGEATTYLRIYFAGVVGLMFYNIGSGILRAVGDSRRPLYFLIFSAVMNIVLDLLFVCVFHMGVAGAAYATILGQWIAAAIGLVMNIRKNPEVSISMKGFRPHGATLSRILAIGIPSVVMQSTRMALQPWVIRERISSICWA